MNKTELIDAMANASGLTKKDAESALNAFTSVVGEEIAKGVKYHQQDLEHLKFLKELRELVEIHRLVQKW